MSAGKHADPEEEEKEEEEEEEEEEIILRDGAHDQAPTEEA